LHSLIREEVAREEKQIRQLAQYFPGHAVSQDVHDNASGTEWKEIFGAYRSLVVL